MRTTTILSGNFATGEGQKGNFSAYNSKGERIFIFKQQMEGAGFKETKDLKFPFFALINEREIDTRDDSGELTGVMVKRLQATAVFKTKEELVNASIADAEIEILSATKLATLAKESGLTEKQLDLIMAASI